MADPNISFEMGSNLAKGLGFIGMQEVVKNLKAYSDRLEKEWIREAIQAAAEVFKQALEAATPVGTKRYKNYKGKTHTPGTAKRNVIIYRRKQPRGVLAMSNLDMALLVGYAKKEAFYMYWYEEGTRNKKRQEARRFAYAVFDTSYQNAMNAAIRVLQQRMAA